MTPSEEEARFDELLRQKFAAHRPAPSAAIWPAVSETLPPVRAGRQPGAGAAIGATGLILGVLLGWLTAWHTGPTTDVPASTTARRAPASALHRRLVPPPGAVASGRASAIGQVAAARPIPPGAVARPTLAATHPARFGNQLTAATSRTTPALVAGSALPMVPPMVLPAAANGPSGFVALSLLTPSQPVRTTTVGVVSLWDTALALDSSIRQTRAVNPDSAVAPATSTLARLVVAQQGVLRVLQHQLDSLKQELPVVPVLAAADSLKPAADSLPRPAPRLARLRPWALALLTESTTAWGNLPAAGYDPTATRESLRAAVTRGAQLERFLGDRWLVRAGLGDTRVSGQFRHTGVRSGQTMVRDSTDVTHLDVFSGVDTTFIVRLDSIARPEARINLAGQVIGYDTVWVPYNDTSYQVIITHDTVRRTERVVRTRLETWTTRQQQQLRPTYRFWTIPVFGQYDFLVRGRWRAGLSVGVQLIVFRGGTRPELRGDAYELRAIGPRDGPFRPVSLAFSTGLDVRCRLTDRLSLLGGAAVRGWALAPTRTGPRPAWQPTGQLGLSWGFGGRR